MEHFNSENLSIFLLAGFSGLVLFKRAMLRMSQVMVTVTKKNKKKGEA